MTENLFWKAKYLGSIQKLAENSDEMLQRKFSLGVLLSYELEWVVASQKFRMDYLWILPFIANIADFLNKNNLDCLHSFGLENNGYQVTLQRIDVGIHISIFSDRKRSRLVFDADVTGKSFEAFYISIKEEVASLIDALHINSKIEQR
jgi:hypothetical protein